MSKDLLKEERYCTNCSDDTMHTCHDSGHERDSSNDWAECHLCHWVWHGGTGKYEPPWDGSEKAVVLFAG